MAIPNRAAVKVMLTPLNGVTSLTFTPQLDGGITNEDSNWDDAFWRHDGHQADAPNGTAVLTNTTEKTGFTVSVAQALIAEGPLGMASHSGPKGGGLHRPFEASKPRLSCVKHVGLVSSSTLHQMNARTEAVEEAARSPKLGYDALKDAHEDAWRSIWDLADIVIEGDEEAQQAIRFNIFHLNQTYRGDDHRLNVGPKGIHR